MSTCLCVSELFSHLILIVKLQSCFLLFMFFCYPLFPFFHFNFSRSFYACLWQRVLLLELASSVHSSCSKTSTSRSCCNCYGTCVLSYILYIRTLSTQTLNWQISSFIISAHFFPPEILITHRTVLVPNLYLFFSISHFHPFLIPQTVYIYYSCHLWILDFNYYLFQPHYLLCIVTVSPASCFMFSPLSLKILNMLRTKIFLSAPLLLLYLLCIFQFATFPL